MRTINSAGLELIKRFEGCSLKVYKDPIGIPTVGYGHVTDLAVGSLISQAQAEELLQEDLLRTCRGIEHLVQAKVTDNQFSALVSFAFNVGLSALKKSHLLAKVNAGDIPGAANEFPRWNRAGGQVLAGLAKRRDAERALFLA